MRLRSAFIWMLCFHCCLARGARADDAVAPAVLAVGDAAIDGSFIQPYDNAWSITAHRGDGTVEDIGISSDHVRAREVDGRRVLLRMESTLVTTSKPGVEWPLRQSSTFNSADARTLRPHLGIDFGADGSRTRHEFTPRLVTTTRQDAHSSDAASSRTELANEVFDFDGGMAGLILAALPLDVGYRADLPSLGAAGVERVRVAVRTHESIRAGAHGNVAAYVVDVGADPVQSTYWISRFPPYVIKVRVASPGGGFVEWNMID